jgi:choline-phosphate cytidylyltransferase
VSVSIAVNRPLPNGPNNIRSHMKPSRVKHQLASSLLSDSDGVDSPTYDGDVESSATAGTNTFSSSRALLYHHHHSSSSTSTLSTPITPAFVPSSHTTPITEQFNLMPPPRATQPDTKHPVFISSPINPNVYQEEPLPSAAAVAAFNPAALTQEDIQRFVQKATVGEPFRNYRINPPPTGRPVRVYADGLFSLFIYFLLRH